MIELRGFLSGPVIKNPPFNARDLGLIPGQGTKNLHASEQLIPCTLTRELCAATKDSAGCNEDLTTATKTQHSQIKKQIKCQSLD